jgi:hypothetical protein
VTCKMFEAASQNSSLVDHMKANEYAGQLMKVTTMHMFRKRPLVDRELTLREMLDDPIVQDVMRRDGVERRHVEQLFETLRPVCRRAA